MNMGKNLLVVVQRFGHEIQGGAEHHAKILIRHLAGRHSIEVASSCAKDHLSWDNTYAPGTERSMGYPVHRFLCARSRNILSFEKFENSLYERFGSLSLEEQENFIIQQGPYCPDLVEFIAREQTRFDRLIFFTYLYYPTVFGLRIAPAKSILVPTAHDEKPIYLPVYGGVFQKPAAIAFNTHAERAFIQKRFDFDLPRHEIVGIGVDVPENSHEIPLLAALIHNKSPYLLYIGRIEHTKSCGELFALFEQFKRTCPTPLKLVLAGSKEIAIPDHSDIHYLGKISESEKNFALANALAFIMPSRFESLSMACLEAWHHRIPVIVQAGSEVLVDQCIRGGGGLYYRNLEEFTHIVKMLNDDDELRTKIGQSGHAFYQEHYNWTTVMKKWDSLIEGDS